MVCLIRLDITSPCKQRKDVSSFQIMYSLSVNFESRPLVKLGSGILWDAEAWPHLSELRDTCDLTSTCECPVFFCLPIWLPGAFLTTKQMVAVVGSSSPLKMNIRRLLWVSHFHMISIPILIQKLSKLNQRFTFRCWLRMTCCCLFVFLAWLPTRNIKNSTSCSM